MDLYPFKSQQNVKKQTTHFQGILADKKKSSDWSSVLAVEQGEGSKVRADSDGGRVRGDLTGPVQP